MLGANQGLCFLTRPARSALIVISDADQDPKALSRLKIPVGSTENDALKTFGRFHEAHPSRQKGKSYDIYTRKAPGGGTQVVRHRRRGQEPGQNGFRNRVHPERQEKADLHAPRGLR